ncbi:MAG: type II toxin-antitoxin system VapC family toxin [Hydrogenophaga sp.]
MACYVDTSVWVALLGHEANGQPIEAWMMRGMPLITSAWTKVEIARALGIKARRGELSQGMVSDMCQSFRDLLGTAGVAQVDCAGTDFQEAALMCEHVASGLRGGDALHLAVAQRSGSSHFLSFDKTLNRQAQQMGLVLVDIF